MYTTYYQKETYTVVTQTFNQWKSVVKYGFRVNAKIFEFLYKMILKIILCTCYITK